jgi:hypothetical protein
LAASQVFISQIPPLSNLYRIEAAWLWFFQKVGLPEFNCPAMKAVKTAKGGHRATVVLNNLNRMRIDVAI